MRAILYFPEFPNTFVLTYSILLADKKYADFDWEVKHYDWNKDAKQQITDKDLENIDVICLYGTPSTPSDNTFEDFMETKIALPLYHPRFIFLPFDYDLYDMVYKSMHINQDGIVTANDINDFPCLSNDGIKKHLKERQLPSVLFSDTETQAKSIKELIENSNKKFNKDAPVVSIFYYGASLTIFYLNLFPTFLPIRIDEKKINTNNFETCLWVYSRNLDDEERIKLINKIKETIYTAYVDAFIEPLFLAPMFKKFKENVPMGKFYTMKYVRDFARAITLHCDPELNNIGNEIFGQDYEKSATPIQEERKKLLHYFKELVSDSPRNEYRERSEALNTIKEFALGCKIFLLNYYYSQRGVDYFGEPSTASIIDDEITFSKSLSFCYDSIITCLAWEYLLSIAKEKDNEVSNAVINQNTCKIKKCSDSLTIRFSKVEKRVIETLKKSKSLSSKIEPGFIFEGGDIEKLIAYTEFVIKRYVDGSIKQQTPAQQKVSFNKFSENVDASYNRNNKFLIYEFLSKLKPYKIYNFDNGN